MSRRAWLCAGGLGIGATGAGLPGRGFGLAELLAGERRAAASPRTASSFGRARSCIVLFMFGAPAHQDVWDLKPEAPAEVRGEFQPIPTSVPGMLVGEHVPQLAQLADRYALIRSMTHPDNTHTVAMHYMLSGIRHKRPSTNPQNAADDFPCFGSVVNYARDSREAPLAGLPASISLNAPANQVSANNHIFPGFFAGFLGNAYDPLFISSPPHEPGFQPFATVDSPGLLLQRRQLLAEVERQYRHLEQEAAVQSFNGRYDRAFDLLTSPATRNAFDLQREPAPLRTRYGSTPFGQGCLLARRLVEAGVRLVTVNWQRDDAYWDTHSNNFVDHKTKLLPNLDRGFSALLEDLEGRGLLDETLIVWLGEFGRTPRINANAGRDHWAPCNTVLLAGAGIPGGQVYGASDRTAAYPLRDPVTPEDLAATIYHLLGIDPHLMLRDPEGRPIAASQGEPVWGLL